MSEENPYAGQGAVLLDIGGQVGALLIAMPEELLGTEIEARPMVPSAGHLPHVEVLRRPTPAGPVCSAVFSELAEGDYELYRRPSGEVELRVTVTGGEVTDATWPEARPPD
ncbi:hypothetical protein [Kribbella catacumbae]|uniref:hypothetical protein n=1 Tax=Kribbella catacumbae TaxID=460086 RepID=UPI0003667ED0|nr:hypothetical protein [Kribbella catacumbae]